MGRDPRQAEGDRHRPPDPPGGLKYPAAPENQERQFSIVPLSLEMGTLELAYVKLAWALGQATDLGKVKDLMLTPIAGEINEREPYNSYLIFQDGLPKVEEFIKKFHKYRMSFFT